MDPPTSSASSDLKDEFHRHKSIPIPQHEKSPQQSNKPSTPRTTNTSESHPSLSPVAISSVRNSPRQVYNVSTELSQSRTQSPPIHRSRNAAKIIKGEIHNVLAVMRSDPRYYSTGDGNGIEDLVLQSGKRIQSRFEYEERQQSFGRGRFWAGVINQSNDWKTNDQRSGTISSHPILQGLRDLHDLLSVMEVEGSSIIGSGVSSSQAKSHINAVTFVTPFAAAVRSKDVDAKTTGEALSALHKFIVYGFVGGHDNEEYDAYHNSMRFPFFSSSSDKIRESISVVAQCIRHCSFEDKSSLKSSATPKRMFSFWSSTDGKQPQGGNPILGQSESTIYKSNTHELPSFLIQPRRAQKSKGKGGSSSSDSSSRYAFLSPSDEGVVLKLLSLSVQVLRCPAGRNFLSPGDVVGIFDTCLYVAIAAGEANRSLLRSAAADALSHCVIVVFGMRGRPSKKQGGHSADRDGVGDDITDEGTNEEANDSDDDWGERDPTEDLAKAAFLVRKSPVKPGSKDEQETTKCNVNVDIPALPLQDEEEPALVAIMHRLATLADPLIHEDETCVLALSLVNIALETMSDVDALSIHYPRVLNIMQNDLCRNLLRLSTSTDLTILGLALRVIFNLFNGIKDHLKIQLEVFLTSVHLRILSFSIPPNSKDRVWSSSPERRELALESLLEFCREPMLMADLYLNYDCDMNCTNLFETICSTLAKVANPENDSVDQSRNTNNSETESEGRSSDEDDMKELLQKPRLNILNRLALEGVLAVIDGIARRCRSSSKYEETLPDNDLLIQMSPPDSGNSAFLGNSLYIKIDEGGSVNSAEYDFCNLSNSSAASKFNRMAAPERCVSEMSENDMEWLSKARHHTSLALRERKQKKRRMAKAAVEFNERSKDNEWIEEAERMGMLPTPATSSSVASFLYSTPKLDKAKIGLYLSKGPKEKYPFNSEVLENFASLFDFSGLSFSEALRTFLNRFRLPGEAQCIDRLMDTFASRLYEVQLSGAGSNEQTVEKTMLDPPRRGNSDGEFSGRTGSLDPPAASYLVDPVFPFKSSDAAFILSFSTIMLNTDLHNPNMKDEKRMTLEQFIRNNRGINDGADLPIEFLTDLYYEIKNNEIQVKQDLLQDGVGGADAFDGILAKANEIATPFFTSNNSAHHKFVQAGVHERDMYVGISSAAINAISAVFVESWDDVLVTKALDGLKNSAYVCSYFGLTEQFNDIVVLLLGFGLDYVGSVATLMYQPVYGELVVKTPEKNDQAVSDLEAALVSRDIPRLPKSFLSTLNTDPAGNQNFHPDMSDMTGSAAHRGLLSLQCALTLSKQHLSSFSEAWPMLLDVMFSLRDVNALPPQLADLDDFADSRGNPLPKSAFANRSHQRVNEYMESMSPSDKSSNNTGFFSSLFGFGQSTRGDKEVDSGNTQKTFPLSVTLQKVAYCAQLEKIIIKTSDIAMAKKILSHLLGSMFPDGDDEELTLDPSFEHNSVFVLELAARLLLSNRVHAAELYPIFLAKFHQLLSPQSVESGDSSESVIVGLKFPYILERIVVTILRACIHLYDVHETSLRDQLNRSLTLIATLPSSYTQAISDRIGCGAAIILRGCFYQFDDSTDDWSTIKCLLDLAAQGKSGRGFVFDGIASVIDSIDYAIPSVQDGEEGHSGDENNDVQLSQCGVEVMASLLLKFMNGSYEEDLSFKVPAMMYIKKVYSFSSHFSEKALADNGSAKNGAHLQENEFETLVTAIYNDACLSQDGVTSKKGFESLQNIIQLTKVASLPMAKWFTFLRLVATSPPSITSQEARISSLSLIGRLFLTLMPELSNQKENWSELEDWTICVASIISDNLQAGRATPLFETTVQTMTNVVNVMSMSGFHEGEGVNFCSWVGETLLYELEKVGASGGATPMIAAAHSSSSN